MHRRGMNLRKGLLRLILPALRTFLPPRAATRFVAGIGRAEYALRPGLRRRFDAAITHGGRHFRLDWDPAALGRELAGNHVRWRTRDQLLDGLPPEKLTELFQVTGRDWLDAALREGRGVILLGNHYGAHLLPAHWLLRGGYAVRLFMERPHTISKFLNRQFETDGPLGQRKLFISRRSGATEAAASVLRAARILKAGMIVEIAGDVRWSGPHTAPARFLGREYTFSATWVALAALTGAPVVTVFCRMAPDGSHQLEFLPPFHVPPDAASDGRAAPWVQACLDAIEQRVREDPANSNDYFFWAESSASAVDPGRPRRGRARARRSAGTGR
ncbi:MAG: lysophospholipid acyltransferase family protein [Isosphaeraceae bacterium]|nr:lysophospholipid acyltransferase family protein [Isosphaeraceae bacterium]